MTIAGDWVAVCVRARGMALHRIGAGGAGAVAVSGTLDAARALLSGSIYGERLASASTLSECQHAVSATILWQLRVLAGWAPPRGGALARTAAAGFERENIAGVAQWPNSTTHVESTFDLGTLATAPAQMMSATTMTELTQTLRRSAWGELGHPDDRGALLDTLTISWLRRMASGAPASRNWAVFATALVAARTVLVDRRVPSARLVELARPFIATEWSNASDLAGLSASFPPSARAILEGVSTPGDLWKAEARLGAVIETDARRLLKSALPGPDIMLGAIAVLAVDGWRLRAALASATSAQNARTREVRDVMA